jgi:hypothetical protein
VSVEVGRDTSEATVRARAFPEKPASIIVNDAAVRVIFPGPSETPVDAFDSGFHANMRSVLLLKPIRTSQVWVLGSSPRELLPSGKVLLDGFLILSSMLRNNHARSALRLVKHVGKCTRNKVKTYVQETRSKLMYKKMIASSLLFLLP